jgi:predicted CoA-binding protein
VKSARTPHADIEAFFEGPAHAVIGVSANRKKFGNVVFRLMGEKQCTVYPVHPTLESVEGKRCYRTVADLPEDVRAVVTVVPPAVTEQVVQVCLGRGIRHFWMQPGSESPAAVSAARTAGATVVQHECILMFLEPVESVHALHRWIKKLVGTYPS